MKNDKQFLESMAQTDSLVDHEDDCGQCEHQRIMGQVARDLLAEGNHSIAAWDKEAKRRWQETKYFKLWQQAKKDGKDPHEVFAEKGWEP
jgi:hypothetical protein